MKRIVLLLLILLFTTTASADYILYVRMENRSGVSAQDDTMRSKKGDIVQIYPMPHTPTDTVMGEYAFLVVPDITAQAISEYKKNWKDTKMKAYRENKLDVDALNLKVGKIKKLNKLSDFTGKIKKKDNNDLISYGINRRVYLAKRPFIKLYNIITPMAHAETISKVCAVGSNCSDEDYNDLQVWEDAKDGDLVTETRQETAELYNDDGDIEYFFQIGGSTTNGTYYMKIEGATGERYNSDNNIGVGSGGQHETMAVVATEGAEWRIMDIWDNYTVLDGFLIEHDGGTRGGVYIEDGTTNTTISNMFFDGVAGNAEGLVHDKSGETTNVIYNSFVDCTGSGVGISTDLSSSITVYNSTITGCSTGLMSYNVASYAYNVVSVDNTTDFGTGFSGSWAGTNNASEDGTAPDTGEVTISTMTDEFVDVTAGAEDYSIKTGSNLIGAGTDNPGSGIYSDDIDEEARTSTWDIGIDELLEGAPATRRIMFILQEKI